MRDNVRHRLMGSREGRSLPDGYWATQIAGGWYLFNPWDVLLAGPADAATVHRCAWCDLWRRIDQELHDEVAAFRDGARPLEKLPHLHRLIRTWDAAKDSPNAIKPSRWRTSTMVAGVVMAVFMAAATAIGPEPHKTADPTIAHERVVPASLPTPTPHPAIVPGSVRSVARPGVRVTASRIRRPPRASYVVVVGKFESSAAAAKMTRLVRSKGYVVNVVPYGAVSEVMTAPLRTRTQAEYVARGLEAVGLQAQLMERR